MSRNHSRIFIFVCTTVLYEFMNLLRNDIYNLISIRICELKYMGSFITVLFIQPMKDVMVEVQVYIICIHPTQQHCFNSRTKNQEHIAFPVNVCIVYHFVFYQIRVILPQTQVIIDAEPQPFMVLFILFFFADHRTTVFTLSKTFETAQKKNLAPLFCQFLS